MLVCMLDCWGYTLIFFRWFWTGLLSVKTWSCQSFQTQNRWVVLGDRSKMEEDFYLHPTQIGICHHLRISVSWHCSSHQTQRYFQFQGLWPHQWAGRSGSDHFLVWRPHPVPARFCLCHHCWLSTPANINRTKTLIFDLLQFWTKQHCVSMESTNYK